MTRLQTSTSQRHDGDASSDRAWCAEAQTTHDPMFEGYLVDVEDTRAAGIGGVMPGLYHGLKLWSIEVYRLDASCCWKLAVFGEMSLFAGF